MNCLPGSARVEVPSVSARVSASSPEIEAADLSKVITVSACEGRQRQVSAYAVSALCVPVFKGFFDATTMFSNSQ